ncbi:MAG: Alpha/beta hydrolase family protein [Elusimicrobia bacterium ADurb.Bin231]|nr:MAG: Alpha/beta hydrolase family protein [Elusimicrobia bacterium ADurb.Bin231]
MSPQRIFLGRVPIYVSIPVLILCFIFLWGYFSSSLVLKVGRSPITLSPKDVGMEYEEVKFTSSDGMEISGWFVRSEHRSSATVITCHGWGANRSDVLPSTFFLAKTGFNILYFDFRNHGQSGGRISSLGYLEALDLKAAIDYLKNEKSSYAEKIGVYGVSMGGSVAILTAAEDNRINAVVADSSFSAFNDIVVRYAELFYNIPEYPLMPVTLFFVRCRLGFDPEKFSAEKHIAAISPRPIFVIHGLDDTRISVSDGIKLFDIAGHPKFLWTVEDADHMESHLKNPVKYQRKVGFFFSKYLL